MTQLIRTGDTLINLDLVKTIKLKRRAKIIDEEAEVYAPRLLVRFAGRDDTMSIDGTAAAMLWDRLTRHSHGIDELDAQLKGLLNDAGILEFRTKLLAVATGLIARILQKQGRQVLAETGFADPSVRGGTEARETMSPIDLGQFLGPYDPPDVIRSEPFPPHEDFLKMMGAARVEQLSVGRRGTPDDPDFIEGLDDPIDEDDDCDDDDQEEDLESDRGRLDARIQGLLEEEPEPEERMIHSATGELVYDPPAAVNPDPWITSNRPVPC